MFLSSKVILWFSWGIPGEFLVCFSLLASSNSGPMHLKDMAAMGKTNSY
jgi:hypothetical protein